jgi:hypothetical protein
MEMPSWQWSYPYNGVDTYTVHFDASPASALCHWRPPERSRKAPRQIYVTKGDGSSVCYEVGTAGRIITLRFAGFPAGSASSGLSLWGFLGMESFLENAANFGEHPFGYYGPDGGTEIPVRYRSGWETFERVQGNVYQGQLVLVQEV